MHLKNSYWWFKSALSPEECQKIIDMGNAKLAAMEAVGESTEGWTENNKQKGAVGEEAIAQNEIPLSEVDTSNAKTYVRDSQVAWLDDQWLYDRIYPFINSANNLAGWNWDFDFSEVFQFTKYNSPGGFYGWHKDGGSDWNEIYRRYIHGVTIPQEHTKYITHNNLLIELHNRKDREERTNQ